MNKTKRHLNCCPSKAIFAKTFNFTAITNKNNFVGNLITIIIVSIQNGAYTDDNRVISK